MPTETRYGLYEKNEILAENSVSKNFILPLELMKDWSQCSTLSDFLSQDDSHPYAQNDQARNILSTIANELLENAIKYSIDQNRLVTLSIVLDHGDILIETVNTTQEKNAFNLSQFVQVLKERSDIETLFFEQLEKSFESDHVSGLGFLGLLKDYNVQLGIQITPHFEAYNNYDVYVKVRIPQSLFYN